MTIREIYITVADDNDGQYYEPPSRVLNLAVIGSNASLRVDGA